MVLQEFVLFFTIVNPQYIKGPFMSFGQLHIYFVLVKVKKFCFIAVFILLDFFLLWPLILAQPQV